ncbi:outer membrane protein [Nonlabens sp. Hel1_33_55]|uniref:TolC family protein n=1 Tax=Nonlabens sp. Hel1_33_55 TaxID=1336802 RepID=UPI000875E544|nr:TolC family protein [Nonlabens sp. Hel1_33_55]SCY30362.1 outer membrane protein [Nonlabens sp. Hel1_33_55]
MKNLFLCIAVFGCFAFAKAQTPQVWTLQECIQYALENNISVKLSELDIDAAEVEKLSAVGNFIPSLNANSSISENTGLSFNPVTNNAQTTTFLSVSGRINVGYTLFDGLRNVKQLQRAKMSQLASRYRLDKMKDDISLFVANNYLEILNNKANLKSLTAQNLVTKEQIDRTQQLVDGGQLPRGDLLEIQATNASEQQQIILAQNAVTISKISLAQLLLIKDYENFDIVDSEFEVIDEEIAEKPVNDIIGAAEATRSEVRIAEQDVELAKKDLQIAKAANYPTISAFFSYDTRYTDATSFSQIVDPDDPVRIEQIGVVQETGQAVISEIPNTTAVITGADPFFDQLYQNDGISYGLQLNIPILNGFSTRSNIERNKINVDRAEFQLEQARLDLESNVYQAYVDVQGSKRAFEAAQTSLESQELAYEYARERYDVGLINAFDFSQSKLRYDNSVISLNQAKYDYIFRLKVLELYFGIDPSELKL